MNLLQILLGAGLLASVGLVAYYKWKSQKADRALDGAKTEVVALDAQNKLARDKTERAEAALQAAHERQRNEDATTASRARNDAGRAADLLNRLRDGKGR